MAKKNTSLVARIFTFVIAILLGLFIFIPTFTVKAESVIGSNRTTVFSTSVSMKDVLSVAFLAEEERDERLVEVTKQRADAILKLTLDGEKEEDATKKVNGYSYSKEYALLKYFDSSTEDAFLGISAVTWLVIAGVFQILMLLALVLVLVYSYLCMQYDNVTLPKWNKLWAVLAGSFGLLISLVLMFAVKGGALTLATATILNVLGYIFLALSIFLPVYVFIMFKGRKSYRDSKKK